VDFKNWELIIFAMNAPRTSRYTSLTYCISVALFFLPVLYFVEEAELILEPSSLPDQIAETIPDFTDILDVELKKQIFFNFMEPIVDDINADILTQRQRVFAIRDKVSGNGELNNSDLRYLSTVTEIYEMEADDYGSLEFLNVLLRRVDKIPASLALAQAANESAWGTSRFAQSGNNFFGQWCYTDGCGIVPMRRLEGASHEVRRFESVRDSVESYIHNLNTFPSYQMLRRIRQQLRQQNLPVDGVSLSDGLESYSARGLDYVDELQRMIHSNNLIERDNPTL
jgi:Bax protein